MNSLLSKFRANDLRSQLIISMVLITLIPLIGLSLGLFYYNSMPVLNSFIKFNENLLERFILMEQSTDTIQLARDIQHFLDKTEMQGLLFSRIIARPELSRREKTDLLYSTLKTYQHIDYVIVRDLEDRVQSTGQPDRQLSSQLQMFMSDEVLFQRTLAGELAFSDPFIIPASDELAMIVSMPVFSDTGTALAALYMQVDLSFIQSITVELNQLIPSAIFVVDSEGKLIAHPDRNRVLVREDMRKFEIVDQFIKSRYFDTTLPYVNPMGEAVWGSGTPIGEMRWGVIGERSQSRAMGPVNEMQKNADSVVKRLTFSMIIGLLFTAILAGAFGALLAVRITSPVQDMMQTVHAISHGDFSRKIVPQGPSDIQILASTLNEMSDAIARYTRDLENQAADMRILFKGSVESLVAAIDAKDPYTRGHSARVTAISLTIAQEMNIPEDRLQELEISALMHDIGKIGIDDIVLKKPGRVTDDELKILQTHPSLGASIMKPISLLQNMIPGMLHHHERWNGSGYPDGLKGDEIPLFGRIIAVADTFDAMTSERPYQETYSFQSSRDLIETWQGSRYDPEVVAAFLEIFPDICNQIDRMRE